MLEINNQYDFFKNINLDDDGNLVVNVVNVPGNGTLFSYTAQDFNDLSAVTGMTQSELAYVFNDQGSKWNPFPSGGTYYSQGIYIYDGSTWVSDRDLISLQFHLDEQDINEIAFISKNDGIGIGFVVKDQDRSDYFPIGAGTLDLTVGDNDLIPRGIDGEQAFGIGYNNKGDGYASITSGWDIINNGNYSMTNGISLTTSGGGVSLTGVALDTSGQDLMVCIGQANTIPVGNPYHLQIGNGSITATGSRVINADVRSDSFRVYKNGSIEAPSLTLNDINTIGTYSLTTKEYVDNTIPYFNYVKGELSRVGQTTIPLMNQQAGIFETYLEHSFTASTTNNFEFGASFIWSMNNAGNNFWAKLSVDSDFVFFKVEPKDAAGSGEVVNIIAGGLIVGNRNTGTDIRYPETFQFNKGLTAGNVYTMKLEFGSDTANLEPTMYQAQLWLEEKTIKI